VPFIARRNPGAALIAAWARASLAGCVRPHAAPLHAVTRSGCAHAHRVLMRSVGHGLRIVVVTSAVRQSRGTQHSQCCGRNKKLLHGSLRRVDRRQLRTETKGSSEAREPRMGEAVSLAKKRRQLS
jgi:hypothetical protein